MILTMRSSAFINNFSKNEDPKVILGATYIVASKNIGVTSKYDKCAMVLLYPPPEVLMEMDLGKVNMKKNGRYIMAYNDYLMSYLVSISTIIKSSIERGSLIVIMSTDKEDSTLGILKLIRKFIFDNFGYVVEKYGDKSELSNIYTDEYNGILELCEYYIKRDKKRKLKHAKLSDYNGKRTWFFDNYNKKTRKQMLKKLKHDWDIDAEDCTPDELFEYVATYLI